MLPYYHSILIHLEERRKVRSKKLYKNNKKQTMFINIEAVKEAYNINLLGLRQPIPFENLDESSNFPKASKSGSKSNKLQ